MNEIYPLKVALLIPTLNPPVFWTEVLEKIKKTFFPFYKKIILDSGSAPSVTASACAQGFECQLIAKERFNHGLARQMLADAAGDCDILIYMTQDAVLYDASAIQELLSAFEDPAVGVAYGRQLPKPGAKTIEAHARLFNYSDVSCVKTYEDRKKWGIKTAFCSNSFAAYRRETLAAVGGFPTDNIFAEDVVVAARALMKGWKVAYVATARVYHSHDYTIRQELQRSFDIGVFHEQNPWLLEAFGDANGEGFRFVKSEFFYVVKKNIFLFPKMLLSIAAKFIGYRLGRNYLKFSAKNRRKLSLNSKYWNKFMPH